MKSHFLGAFIASILLLAFHYAWFHPTEPSVVFVGTDCTEGSSVAVAANELALPACANVEIHEVAR